MAQSMRQSLIFINSVMVEATERLNQEQLNLERLLRSSVDQYMYFLTNSLSDLVVGIPSDEAAQSRRQIESGNFLDFFQQKAREALERLTQRLHTLDQAFDLLTDQDSPQAVIERFNEEQNRGEETLESTTQEHENTTQEHGTLNAEDIEDLFEVLVGLRSRASHMREEYSVWAGLSGETQTHGAPSSARTTMALRVSCLEEVSIDLSHLEDETFCAICLEMFALRESCKQLPCLHMYHQHCILPWLRDKNSCPLCRCELRIDEL